MLSLDQLKAFYPQFFKRAKVGEIDSLNINGSVRGFFSDCAYTGFCVGVEPAKMLLALNQQIQAVRLDCWAPAFGLVRG